MHSASVLATEVTVLTFREQVDRIIRWAAAREHRFVCTANAHMLVTARRDSAFRAVLSEADTVTPDGVPVLWMMRLKGAIAQDRIAGMDLLPVLCARAETEGIGVWLVGSTPEILEALAGRIRRDHPALRLHGVEALPFGPELEGVDEDLAARIDASGAGLVFVSLGCPKQELWMHRHRPYVAAVQIGLGGAFPVYAGLQPRASALLRRVGLEWAYRLWLEPRRLWSRYLITNAQFIWFAVQDLLSGRSPGVA